MRTKVPLAAEVRRQELDLRAREAAAPMTDDEDETPSRRRRGKAKDVVVVETRADVTINGRVGAACSLLCCQLATAGLHSAWCLPLRACLVLSAEPRLIELCTSCPPSTAEPGLGAGV